MDTGDFCGSIPEVPVLTTPRNSYDYNMFHKNRGVCLILENENFSKKQDSTRSLGRRHGSNVDAESSIGVFSALGFEVYRQKDLTRSQTLRVLKQVSAMDHRENDCFVCVILTHGDHGELYAVDGKLPLDLIFRYFLPDQCPTLCGKPKLFFIQACQGDALDPGVLVQQSRDSTELSDKKQVPCTTSMLTRRVYFTPKSLRL